MAAVQRYNIAHPSTRMMEQQRRQQLRKTKIGRDRTTTMRNWCTFPNLGDVIVVRLARQAKYFEVKKILAIRFCRHLIFLFLTHHFFLRQHQSTFDDSNCTKKGSFVGSIR